MAAQSRNDLRSSQCSACSHRMIASPLPRASKSVAGLLASCIDRLLNRQQTFMSHEAVKRNHTCANSAGLLFMAISYSDVSRPQDKRNLLVSKAWIQAVAVVVLFGFFVLGFLAYKTYSDEAPIPKQVLNAAGNVLFTGSD